MNVPLSLELSIDMVLADRMGEAERARGEAKRCVRTVTKLKGRLRRTRRFIRIKCSK
jgi:hypothetical protein